MPHFDAFIHFLLLYFLGKGGCLIDGLNQVVSHYLLHIVFTPSVMDNMQRRYLFVRTTSLVEMCVIPENRVLNMHTPQTLICVQYNCSDDLGRMRLILKNSTFNIIFLFISFIVNVYKNICPICPCLNTQLDLLPQYRSQQHFPLNSHLAP